jgi:hypothetical protein
MKVHVYSKFSKNNIWKKWNLQAPWGMEDFTLPSVGTSFKNESVVHPLSQNSRTILIIPKKEFKKILKLQKKRG